MNERKFANDGIIVPDAEMTCQVKKIWELAFEDGEKFRSFFFEKLYSPEKSLAVQTGGEILSILSVLSYGVSLWGQELAAGYVYGVATLPNFRGKGYMTRLLNEAIVSMKKKGYALTLIVPQNVTLFELYSRFGYAKSLKLPRRKYIKSELETEKKFECKIYEGDAELLFDLYKKSTNKFDRHVSKTAEIFSLDLMDHFLAGGRIFVVESLGKKEKTIEGFCLALMRDNELCVTEIIVENSESRDSLLCGAMEFFSEAECGVSGLCSDGGESDIIGMARVLDPKPILEILTQNSSSLKGKTLRLSDEVIEENNGIYRLEDNCEKLCGFSKNADMELNILQLSQMISGDGIYCNLMFN